MKILAFDPGYARLGWGTIHSQSSGMNVELLGCGVIETQAKYGMSMRMNELYLQIRRLIKKWKPEHITMERLYFSKNQKTAAGVFQSQGIILAAAGLDGYSVKEFEPKRIKRALSGSGNVTKNQLMNITCRLLHRKESIQPDDAADAVAGAIAASFYFYSEQKKSN